MPRFESYWPPLRRRAEADGAPVRRRHVLYVPGYDDQAKTRSRSLFVRELIRYGRRFDLAERKISPVEEIPVGLRWTVRTAKDDWVTDTTYDVLRWDDIVEKDFRRPMPVTIFWQLYGMLDSVVTGLMPRLYRMNWLFASVGVYPLAMVLLLGAVAGGLGYATAALLMGLAGLPGIFAAPAGIAVAVGIAILVRPYYARIYVWHLLHDWLFNWEHGRGKRQDYAERVNRFADHLRTTVAESGADEVLIFGHSSGAGMAIEVAARALEWDPDLGRRGPDVAVLTLGTSMPAAAMNSRAKAIWRDLERLMTAPDVLWVEYQAPQDWLNAAGFNPVRMLPLALAEEACTNPVIRSARFRDITTPATYATLSKSLFRLHFQFMMANDRPGEYDFIMMMLGPMRLSQRIANPEAAAKLVGAPAVADPQAA